MVSEQFPNISELLDVYALAWNGNRAEEDGATWGDRLGWQGGTGATQPTLGKFCYLYLFVVFLLCGESRKLEL